MLSIWKIAFEVSNGMTVYLRKIDLIKGKSCLAKPQRETPDA